MFLLVKNYEASNETYFPPFPLFFSLVYYDQDHCSNLLNCRTKTNVKNNTTPNNKNRSYSCFRIENARKLPRCGGKWQFQVSWSNFNSFILCNVPGRKFSPPSCVIEIQRNLQKQMCISNFWKKDTSIEKRINQQWIVINRILARNLWILPFWVPLEMK